MPRRGKERDTAKVNARQITHTHTHTHTKVK